MTKRRLARVDWLCDVVRETVSVEELAEIDSLIHYSVDGLAATGEPVTQSGSELLSAKLRVSGGERLVSRLNPRRGHIALTASHDLPAVCSGEWVVLRPRSEVDLRFLYYVFQSERVRSSLEASVRSVTKSHGRVDASDISKMWLQLPDVSSQRKIADFLDRETQRADATSRAFFVLSQLLAERLKSIVDSKVLPGPSSSDDWKRYRLKHLAASPITTGVGLPAEHEEHSWPRYIRTTDIDGPRSLRSDVFFSQPPELVDAAGVQKYDLLMTAAGATIGKTYLHLTDSPAVYAGYLARFRSGPHVEPRFVAFWAQSSNYWAQIEQGAVRSTIDNFSAGRYQNLEIWCPPLETQVRIADELDAYVATHDEAQREIADLRRLTDERREAVVTAAVTGKLRLETVA